MKILLMAPWMTVILAACAFGQCGSRGKCGNGFEVSAWTVTYAKRSSGWWITPRVALCSARITHGEEAMRRLHSRLISLALMTSIASAPLRGQDLEDTAPPLYLKFRVLSNLPWKEPGATRKTVLER